MTRRHVTQDEALDALCDYRVPPAEAIELFRRAFRRSNDATRAFTLHVGGVCRTAGEERDAMLRWSDDGGAVHGEIEWSFE